MVWIRWDYSKNELKISDNMSYWIMKGYLDEYKSILRRDAPLSPLRGHSFAESILMITLSKCPDDDEELGRGKALIVCGGRGV
jgi:hypothetical protein